MDERDYATLRSINSGINAVEDKINWLLGIGVIIAGTLLVSLIHHW